jgi:hypothetical protein
MANHILNITGAHLNKVLDTAEHASFEDLVDGLHTSASPQSILAGTETRITNDGTVRDEMHFPSHITKLWDTSLNIATFSEELDNPVYVIRFECTLDPASTGECEFQLYVNDATPKLIQTSFIAYKNAIARTSVLFTFYLGEETGYDVKNDGVYLSINPSTNLDLYDKTLLIYKT